MIDSTLPVFVDAIAAPPDTLGPDAAIALALQGGLLPSSSSDEGGSGVVDFAALLAQTMEPFDAEAAVAPEEQPAAAYIDPALVAQLFVAPAPVKFPFLPKLAIEPANRESHVPTDVPKGVATGTNWARAAEVEAAASSVRAEAEPKTESREDESQTEQKPVEPLSRPPSDHAAAPAPAAIVPFQPIAFEAQPVDAGSPPGAEPASPATHHPTGETLPPVAQAAPLDSAEPLQTDVNQSELTPLARAGTAGWDVATPLTNTGAETPGGGGAPPLRSDLAQASTARPRTLSARAQAVLRAFAGGSVEQPAAAPASSDVVIDLTEPSSGQQPLAAEASAPPSDARTTDASEHAAIASERSTLRRVEAPSTGTDQQPQDAKGQQQNQTAEPRLVRQATGPVKAEVVAQQLFAQHVAAPQQVSAILTAGHDVLSQPVAEHAAELTGQIVQAVRLQWRHGVGEATLRLQPEHLGPVTVALRVERGTVTAVLQADNPVVQQWIEGHANQLRSALADQGLQLDRFVVRTDPDGRQAGRRPEQKTRNAKRHTPGARFELTL